MRVHARNLKYLGLESFLRSKMSDSYAAANMAAKRIIGEMNTQFKDLKSKAIGLERQLTDISKQVTQIREQLTEIEKAIRAIKTRVV